LNSKLKFYIQQTITILTNSCNIISRKLKALSIVHSNYSKISLKMSLQLGRNM